mgnify:CR=1 FL=1
MNALTQPVVARLSLASSQHDLHHARSLFDSTVGFVRQQASVSKDPYVISRFGDVHIRIEVAAALLERAEHAPTDAVWLLGAGESSDAYHMSAPHPEGLGAQMAMQAALRSASLAAGDIDYINLHGTATPANDSAEGKAVMAVFGERVPCSSTKGATGHTLGAAGAVEAVLCAIALVDGLTPGSPGTRALDPALPMNYQLRAAPATLRHARGRAAEFILDARLFGADLRDDLPAHEHRDG